MQTKFAYRHHSLRVDHIVAPQTCMCVASQIHKLACSLQYASHSLHFAGTKCGLSAKCVGLVVSWKQSMWYCVRAECEVCGAVGELEAKYADHSLHACGTMCKLSAMPRPTSLHVHHIKAPQVCMCVMLAPHKFACALQCADHSLHVCCIKCALVAKYVGVYVYWLQTWWEYMLNRGELEGLQCKLVEGPARTVLRMPCDRSWHYVAPRSHPTCQ